MTVAAVVWLAGRPIVWWQHRQTRVADSEAGRRAEQSARTALATEIDSNLTQLQMLWDDLARPQGRLDRRPASPEILGAVRLAWMDPIRWRRSVWEDRSIQSTASLSRDELEVVSSLYDDFNRLDVLKGSLGTPWYTMADNWNLHDDGKRAWAELQDVARRILSRGNPLIESTSSEQ